MVHANHEFDSWVSSNKIIKGTTKIVVPFIIFIFSWPTTAGIVAQQKYQIHGF